MCIHKDVEVGGAGGSVGWGRWLCGAGWGGVLADGCSEMGWRGVLVAQ